MVHTGITRPVSHGGNAPLKGGAGSGPGRIPPSRALKLLHQAGLSIPIVAHASGLSEGQLSRMFRGERGGQLRTVVRVVDSCPGVDLGQLLRALVTTRAEYLQRKNVQRLIETR
jgi:hypothetical protein